MQSDAEVASMKQQLPRAALAKRWRDFYRALGARGARDPEKPDALPEAVRLAIEATAGVLTEVDPLPANEWEFELKRGAEPFVLGDRHSAFEWILAVFASRDPHVYAASLGISVDKPEDESARRGLMLHLAKDAFLHLEADIQTRAVEVIRPAYRHDRVNSTERDHTRDALTREVVRKFAERGGYRCAIVALAKHEQELSEPVTAGHIPPSAGHPGTSDETALDGELRQAPESVIHETIKEAYDRAERDKQKPPNVNQIGAPVQNLLRGRGYTASKRRIKELAADQQHAARRRKAGPTVAHENRKQQKEILQ
jgi:hypothetical protein